jgi:hypothetical protein
MAIKISPKVREKLTVKHRVNEEEIEQCFHNRTCDFMIDIRAEHRTNPITRWFISETDVGRQLKIAFIPMGDDLHIRSAYEPNEAEKDIYRSAWPIE